MSVFVRPPDVIEREPVVVMSASCRDEEGEIQRLWSWFEELVGLRGRKMYGVVDVAGGTYSSCTPVRSGDDVERLGLEVAELPGGRFRRGRLRGAPPALYSLIPIGVAELESGACVDPSRPVVEFYKRFDEVELWLPLTARPTRS